MQKNLIIVTEKVVTKNGEMAFKIKKIDSLPHSELPDIYLEGVPRFVPWSYGWELVTSEFKERVFPDEIFTLEKWGQLLTHIQAAGDRLNKINIKRRAYSKFWKGETVFII